MKVALSGTWRSTSSLQEGNQLLPLHLSQKNFLFNHNQRDLVMPNALLYHLIVGMILDKKLMHLLCSNMHRIFERKEFEESVLACNTDKDKIQKKYHTAGSKVFRILTNKV